MMNRGNDLALAAAIGNAQTKQLIAAYEQLVEEGAKLGSVVLIHEDLYVKKQERGKECP